MPRHPVVYTACAADESSVIRAALVPTPALCSPVNQEPRDRTRRIAVSLGGSRWFRSCRGVNDYVGPSPYALPRIGRGSDEDMLRWLLQGAW